jgi:hypothetical protein
MDVAAKWDGPSLVASNGIHVGIWMAQPAWLLPLGWATGVSMAQTALQQALDRRTQRRLRPREITLKADPASRTTLTVGDVQRFLVEPAARPAESGLFAGVFSF